MQLQFSAAFPSRPKVPTEANSKTISRGICTPDCSKLVLWRRAGAQNGAPASSSVNSISQSITVKRYYLASHAYTCTTDRHWLFLNLLSDQYFAVEKAQMAAIQQFLHGFDTDNPLSCAEPIENQEVDLLSVLTELELITQDASRGKAMRSLQTLAASDAIDSTLGRPSFGDWVANVPRVAYSLYRTHRWLTHEPLHRTVSRIERRKLAVKSRTPIQTQSMEFLSGLIAVFNAIRPLFPRDYKCLFDSLALLEFLIPIQSRIEWIFGVAADPFAAHCWLQLDGTVLNDTLESIAGYRPIMCV